MDSSSRFDVIGIGSSPLDILSLVDHLPTREEVQQIEQIEVQGGGPVATALVTLARLGAKTAMLDAIGDDWRGQLVLAGFQQAGVETSGIKVREGCSSSTANILVEKSNGNRTILFTRGNASEITPEELPVEWIRQARCLHVNGRHWQACLNAIEIARQNGVLVSFDGGAGRYTVAMRKLVPLTNICIVAKQFALDFTGQSDLLIMGDDLLKQGPQCVVITDGTSGSWIFQPQKPAFHQPAFLMDQIIDTTGCGDSYHGAFLFALLRGIKLNDTAAFASAVAAINTQSLGGQKGLPSLSDVKTFLRKREVFLSV